ncbi:MAG: hydroxymethylglutaryl-CoA lyase [Alphaproteobacteria bacterium]|jgi:isopropylmalate/homocitrate/citramalate synthase|nr:hydroxymethylglutaryl-CoA lyase [Alphaproteobacteria bacterium]MDP7221994.1 hydroxymethylglutaryl-CoA lyase [Alphaproteobacteria bacterium]
MTQNTHIKIYEVGPRDGLQNEKQIIPTDQKLALIAKLAEAGLKYIEATSFVSPKWVPQMADHNDIMHALRNKDDGVTYAALVPNDKGMTNAVHCGVKEVAVFAAASEGFSRKNINCTIAESIARFEPVLQTAKAEQIAVRGYVSCVAGCPYDGDVPVESVVSVSKQLYKMGCYEISLGDTIGIGRPAQITDIITAVSDYVPLEHIALHCHDTHGRALDNIKAALACGVRVFDSAAGGLGGCPYAEGASGNVATDAVVKMLHESGYETSIDLDKLHAITNFIRNKMNIEQRETCT